MKEKDYKVVTVAALVIAVLALSVGFASYSTILYIQDASATASYGEDPFAPSVQYKDGSLLCKKDSNDTVVEDAGSFDNSEHATIWNDASVALAGPGDSVTCSAIVENLSSFPAYFNQVVLSDKLICSGSNTINNLDAACQAIHLSVKIADTEYGTASSQNYSGNDNISNLLIDAGGEKKVSFTISYEDGGAVANEVFSIAIPTIQFVTDTID